VTITFKTPSNVTGISSFVLYRKSNADPSCAAYERVVGRSPSPPINPGVSITTLDPIVPNAIAWDYVVASRGAGGESGFSKAALAIPTGAPRDFRTCVEKPVHGL